MIYVLSCDLSLDNFVLRDYMHFVMCLYALNLPEFNNCISTYKILTKKDYQLNELT